MSLTVYDLIIAAMVVFSVVLMITIAIADTAEPLIKVVIIPCIFIGSWNLIGAVIETRNKMIKKN